MISTLIKEGWKSDHDKTLSKQKLSFRMTWEELYPNIMQKVSWPKCLYHLLGSKAVEEEDTGLPLQGSADNIQGVVADNLEDTALGLGHNSGPVLPLLHDYQPLLRVWQLRKHAKSCGILFFSKDCVTNKKTKNDYKGHGWKSHRKRSQY